MMKKQIKALFFLAIMGFSSAVLASPIDTVIVNDGFYGQNQSVTFTEGSLTGDPITVGAAAIYGTRFDLFFTQLGGNVILDHLFSQGGGVAGRPDDNILFSARGMTDAFIGTTCTANQVCIGLTGNMQDVTQQIIAQIGADNWCGGGGICNVSIESQGVNVPEPSSIALLGLGLLGFAASHRKSAKSKNA
jgi:hypothetical protein